MKPLSKSFLGLLLFILLFSGALLPNAFAGDIVVFGDSRTNESVQRKIVHTILSFKPSAVFAVGDIVSDGNDPKEWKLFNDINGPLLKASEYFPALGNHEKSSSLYFGNFPFLNHKRWYSVEREGIHFIILDSNSDLRSGSEQYNWLVSDLESVKVGTKFKIAMFHHPVFTVGRHEPGAKKLKGVLLPLFRKYGVCAVFSGHDHNYQRFEYKGISFIVTGGGGAPLYGQVGTSPYLRKFEKTYHFCVLSPGTDTLRVRVVGIDSKIIDSFTIPSAKSSAAILKTT